MSEPVGESSAAAASSSSSLPPLPPSDYHDEFMLEAMEEAKLALAKGEVPVGCVFVAPSSEAGHHHHHDGLKPRVIARGHNLTNERKNALEHAELVAIAGLEKKQNEEDETTNRKQSVIEGCHLYVTVEPCIMCAAALLYHGIGKVFFGCRNPRFGGNGTVLSLHDDHMGGLWEQQQQQQCNHNSSSAGSNSSSQVAAAAVVGYESLGGFHEKEAVVLLQQFYEQDNPSVAEPKSVRKKRTE